MTPPRLRIFISSPGDVAEERVLANNLIRRLADEFERQLRIEPVFWEHEPLLATGTFQTQIPPPRDCEVAICILWSRIGTRLPPEITRAKETRFGPAGSGYASGTEYEFEDAALGFEESGKPDLLVYRKTADPVVSLQDETALLQKLQQKQALDAFIRKWFFNPDLTLKAAFHPFATTAQFEQTLEEHLRKLIARRLPVEDATVTAGHPSWAAGSPFRGLEVFEFEHAPIFFGRTRAVGDLLTALRSASAAGKAFVLVVGVSGGGKSSLVRAGLLPLLTQAGVVEGVGLWRRAVMRPGDGGDPLRSLAAALLAAEALPELAADGTTPAALAESLRRDPAVAVGLIKGALSQAAASLARQQSLGLQPEARLALVVDQVEELFTLPDLSAIDRQAFVAVLSALARGGKVWVVGTVRGDFYHRCFELPELMALQEGTGQYALPLPTAAEIGQMIRQPAKAAGLVFEEDPQTKVSLDEVLREAAGASPESLPLLEFALEELYLKRTEKGILTYAAYKELGGVEGALARRAEGVYESLPSDAQESLPRVMRGLVSIGDGDAIARRQAAIDVVAPTPAARTLVDAFVKARLFSADRTEQGGAVVRVTHEALLRNWPRVKSWLDQDKELLIVRGRVSAAAARWEKQGRAADLLLSEGIPLAEAENLAAKRRDELSDTERSFIAASQNKRRHRRALKRAAVTSLVILAIAVALTLVLASRASARAAADRQLADAAKALADRRLQSVSDLSRLLDGIDLTLNDLPGSTPARQQLAAITLQSLNGFETDANTGSDFLLALGRANGKVASLLGSPYSSNTGEVGRAMEAYRKSRTILEQLTAADPHNDEARLMLAGCYMDMGGVQEETGEVKASLDNCLKARELYMQIAAAKPTDRRAAHKTLRACIAVGDAQVDLGRFDAAEESFQQALKIGRELAAESPTVLVADPGDERLSLLDLSTCLERLGVDQIAMGRNAPSLANQRETLVIREKVAARFGITPYVNLSLIVSHRKIGDVQLVMNDLPEALASYTEAGKRSAQLYEADKTNSRWARNLWATQKGRAEVLLRMGRPKDALDLYKAALALSQQMPSDSVATFTHYQLSWSFQGIAECLSQIGPADEAVKNAQAGLTSAQHWADADRDDARARQNLALAHVRLGRALAAVAGKENSSPADRLAAWKQAAAEFEAGKAIVDTAQLGVHFDASLSIWVSHLPAELGAARHEIQTRSPATQP